MLLGRLRGVDLKMETRQPVEILFWPFEFTAIIIIAEFWRPEVARN